MGLAAILSLGAGWLFFMICGLVGMVTHIVITLKASAFLLLIVGVILPPIGIVHGLGHLLGFF